MRVLGFAGSLRQGSLNRALLAAAADLAPPGVEVESVELRDLPLYDGDVERAGTPAVVRAFTDLIAAADGVLIATPEYNESISGVLHNALDWASRPSGSSPLRDKPVAIMGAAGGRSGTARAQAHLRVILNHLRADVVLAPEVLVGRARDAFDDAGRLVDPGVREQVAELLQALARRAANARAMLGT